MTKYDWLLFVHVAGAFCFLSGAVMTGVVQLAAFRRERPSELALLFNVNRVGVSLVGIGSLLALAFGIWLAEYLGYGVGDEWVVAAIALWAASGVLGGIGGSRAKKARLLAQELARGGDRPSRELRRLVTDPVAAALNYGSGALLVAILVLMVWKPGAG